MSIPGRRQIEGDDIGNRDWRRSLVQKPRKNRVVERRQWGDSCRSPISRRLVDTARIVVNFCPQAAANSLLWPPRLAQRVERRLEDGLASHQEFDAQLGIEPARFGERSLGLIHFVLSGMRGRQ